MKKVVAKLDHAGRLAENSLLVVLLGTMILLSVSQIANRQFFGGSINLTWADELIKLIVLWLAMVGSIAAARDGKHIRIDLISHLVADPVVRWSRVVVDLFAAAVCGFIGYQAWKLIMLEREWGDLGPVDVPIWIVHAIVPAAFFLISFRFVVDSGKRVFMPEDKTA
ncbi:MAG: TRAP transporter small permease [Pseudomonadota bacterium]